MTDPDQAMLLEAVLNLTPLTMLLFKEDQDRVDLILRTLQDQCQQMMEEFQFQDQMCPLVITMSGHLHQVATMSDHLHQQVRGHHTILMDPTMDQTHTKVIPQTFRVSHQVHLNLQEQQDRDLESADHLLL